MYVKAMAQLVKREERAFSLLQKDNERRGWGVEGMRIGPKSKYTSRQRRNILNRIVRFRSVDSGMIFTLYLHLRPSVEFD